MPINAKTVLAIIPARGGSRRTPNKNLAPYRGIPLIQHAINHAKASRYIDTIAISSDSDTILAFATPPILQLLRPPFLASSQASSEAVIAHALYSLPHHDYVVLLQPTSPNRTAADIDSCLEIAEHHHGRAISVNETGSRNGAVYVAKTELFLETLSLDSTGTVFIMPDSRSLDIDYPEDFGK